ncbi:MAG: NAD-dependent epimerase/dehydratase family protein [Rhodococcus sp. (in: high G+C Gram-positive bacteria)]
MNHLHVVIGAGPVGWAVAEQLAAQGHSVRVLTRSGSGPDGPTIDRRRVDIETDDLRTHFAGAAAIYNCTHVAYSNTVWREKLPTMEKQVLDAAAGTVVVFPESLYAYGLVKGPIREDLPRSATHHKLGVRTELLAARDAHATPTVSVGASDFYGPHVKTAHMGERVVPKVLTGQTVRVIANADLPHAFTYVPDFGAAMITAAATPSLWNTFLHAPTAPAVSQRDMIHLFARAAGVEAPKIGTIPAWVMRTLGVVSRPIAELVDTLYQFEHPYILDSSRSEDLLGQTPTPLVDGTAATVAWWKAAELTSAP